MPDGTGHRLLQHRLYVEVLDAHGAPCPPGERGEVTLSGGFNPFLPLLRYRTGDWASLDNADPSQLVLIGLEGREPVVFRGGDGRSINNIDVTGALKLRALTEYSLHQFADGGLRLRVPGSMSETSAARDALLVDRHAKAHALVETARWAVSPPVVTVARPRFALHETPHRGVSTLTKAAQETRQRRILTSIEIAVTAY